MLKIAVTRAEQTGAAGNMMTGGKRRDAAVRTAGGSELNRPRPGKHEAMDNEYSHFSVVRQEHLNQYGRLFGGHLLSIIDEMAYVACVRTFPGGHFLTRALQEVEFHVSASLGDVLETHAVLETVGRTSCRVRVRVYICETQKDQRRLSFDGLVVMVCVDEAGCPCAIREKFPRRMSLWTAREGS